MKKKAELSLEVAKEMYKSGGVAKQFALDNYTEQELTTKEVKCWEDLEIVDGWYLGSHSCISKAVGCSMHRDNRNIFATKEQAEATIAIAMLSQLMKDVNGDWKPDWRNCNDKYVIIFVDEKIETPCYQSIRVFLAFSTREIRDKFLENHRSLIEKAKPLL